MAKVLITEQYLTDIANAIRAKTGITDKLKVSDMASKITSITTSSGSGGTMYTVTLQDPGTGQHYIIESDDVAKTETFQAEKGSIISATLEADDGYNAGNLIVIGGKLFPDDTYSLTSNMSISASGASEKPEGMTLLGKTSIRAKSDGSLTGYTLTRVLKCIPNNSTVHFVVTLFCPTGTTPADSILEISDFASGRAFDIKNAAGWTPTVTNVSGGKEYTLEWNEAIAVATKDYLDDDAAENNLLTYYCCSEVNTMNTTGSTTALTGCTLKIEIYSLPATAA